MGVVYRAQDPAIGRTIAIKTIRLSELTDPTERERLRDRLFREAQSAGILSHPNIVTIYDILEEGGLAYIFMEFVNGPPLEALLSAERPPSGSALLSILRQTAGALDYAHSKGIVHRDIKPGNIMIHDATTAKITDFGVAKILSQQMTQAGMMMGTPSYMSPEQVEGAGVTGAADQFSLAVIAYEVLTGEKPFVAEQLATLLYRICREEPAPAQRLNPTLAGGVDAALRRALSKNPHNRYPSCGAFVDELQQACDTRPGWVAYARGASQSMPTVNTAVDPPTMRAGPGFGAMETIAAIPNRPTTRAKPWRQSLHKLLPIALPLLLMGIGYAVYRNWPPPPAAQVAAAPAAVPAPADTKPSPATGRPTAASDAASAAPRSTEPAQEAPAPPSDESTALPMRTPAGLDVITRIITSPPGARVTVDGNLSLGCTAPCSLPLEQGRHSLTASHESYRDLHRIIEVPRDSNVSMDMERQIGALSVSSSPPGAIIVINGEQRSERTPAVLKLPAGSYRLQVISGDVKTDEETIVVRDGAMSQRRYTVE